MCRPRWFARWWRPAAVDLGESRPQQLWEKAAALADLPIRWHLIGHLQRNKVRRTLPLVAMIHSVDSPRLLAAIDEEWAAAVQTACSNIRQSLPVLLEVNISGESAKHGFAPETIEPLLADLAGYRHVAVRGLMCMAGLEGGRTSPAAISPPCANSATVCVPLSAGRHARRAFDGHERRLRDGDRGRGHDRPRRLGTVRGNRIPNGS